MASRGQVVDANLMRIAADLGLQGLALFLLVLFFAYKSAIRHRTLAAAGLISTFIIVASGTNTLDSHLVGHCFWLFLAFIDAEAPQLNEATEPVLVPLEAESVEHLSLPRGRPA